MFARTLVIHWYGLRIVKSSPSDEKVLFRSSFVMRSAWCERIVLLIRRPIVRSRFESDKEFQGNVWDYWVIYTGGRNWVLLLNLQPLYTRPLLPSHSESIPPSSHSESFLLLHSQCTVNAQQCTVVWFMRSPVTHAQSYDSCTVRHNQCSVVPVLGVIGECPISK